MAYDRSKYPLEWDEIALKTKELANWKCESCDRPCRKPRETLLAFCERVTWNIPVYMRKELAAHLYTQIARKPQQWTLTVAHLDHDPENPDARLMALCSGCHLRYDAPRKAQDRRRKTREAKGQIVIEEAAQ